MMKQFYTPFIYKDYHINIGGPNANHVNASMIYEDAIPPSDVFSSYKSLKERNALVDFIRGAFISVEEGEIIKFDGGKNSLNSRLKLIELNQYNPNYFSSNPYKSLPQNMMIYRSCYPITYDKKDAGAQCSKAGLGLNLRIYKINLIELISRFDNPLMTKGLEKLILTTKNKFKNTHIDVNGQEIITYNLPNAETFNLWRELKYYEYIRYNIDKTFVSPNFVQSYCWFINTNADMSFKKNGPSQTQSNTYAAEDLLFTNTTLVLLTESPNQNLYDWAANIYTTDRNVKRQIYSGYKPDHVWKSVIAQMMLIFNVMYKKEFTFESIKIPNNFYIKDVNVYGDSKQYWKYIVDGIEFYIPNYGHLLMFDHDYHDLDITNNNNDKYKIISSNNQAGPNFINSLHSTSDIRKKIITQTSECINTNIFGQEFKANYSGVLPSSNIMNWLAKISNNIETLKNSTTLNSSNELKEFNNMVLENLIEFVHNRVGTKIRDPEYSYIRKNDIRPFKKGELVVFESFYETFDIILFISSESETQAKCITKNNDDLQIILLPKDLLYHYSEYETIKQDLKPGDGSFNLDYVIETYRI